MPKVHLGKKNYEAEFGSVIRGSVYAKGQCQQAEKVIGVSRGTLSSRFREPGKMSLAELKRFIKFGHIPREDVIAYLYEEEVKHG